MKYLLSMIFGMALTMVSYSQKSSDWISIQDTVFDITFLMPRTPTIVDTLNTKLYAVEIDTAYSLEVHIYDTAVFNMNDTVFNQVLSNENNDTLRVIAKLILFATNSEITQIVEIETNGIKGLEIGISYKSLASEAPLHSFIRYYLHKNRFLSFSVTGTQSSMLRAFNAKNQFYESINIQ